MKSEIESHDRNYSKRSPRFRRLSRKYLDKEEENEKDEEEESDEEWGGRGGGKEEEK